MRTGRIIGLGLVGDQPGPLVDLHQRAGHGDAALGEDHAVPARLRPRLISDRAASGLVGSTGKVSTSGRNGFTHQRWAMKVSTAKVGRPGRKAAMQHAHRGRRRGSLRSPRAPRPLRSSRCPAPRRDRRRRSKPAQQRLDQRSPAAGGRCRAPPRRLTEPKTRKISGTLKPSAIRHGRDDRARHHEERVDDVVGGDDAGAVAGLAARLEHGVERHDEEAAGDREQQQVDEHAPGPGWRGRRQARGGRPSPADETGGWRNRDRG